MKNSVIGKQEKIKMTNIFKRFLEYCKAPFDDTIRIKADINFKEELGNLTEYQTGKEILLCYIYQGYGTCKDYQILKIPEPDLLLK